MHVCKCICKCVCVYMCVCVCVCMRVCLLTSVHIIPTEMLQSTNDISSTMLDANSHLLFRNSVFPFRYDCKLDIRDDNCCNECLMANNMIQLTLFSITVLRNELGLVLSLCTLALYSPVL